MGFGSTPAMTPLFGRGAPGTDVSGAAPPPPPAPPPSAAAPTYADPSVRAAGAGSAAKRAAAAGAGFDSTLLTGSQGTSPAFLADKKLTGQ